MATKERPILFKRTGFMKEDMQKIVDANEKIVKELKNADR